MNGQFVALPDVDQVFVAIFVEFVDPLGVTGPFGVVASGAGLNQQQQSDKKNRAKHGFLLKSCRKVDECVGPVALRLEGGRAVKAPGLFVRQVEKLFVFGQVVVHVADERLDLADIEAEVFLNRRRQFDIHHAERLDAS